MSQRYKELLTLKEELKKESSSEDASPSRLVDLLTEIERLCEKVTRENFIESKVGGTVKKIADGQDAKVASIASKLMEKWRVAFAKTAPIQPPEATSTLISSMVSPKASNKISEITNVGGPQDPKRQKMCRFLAEAFSADLEHEQPELISSICIEIEAALSKLEQDQYVSKGRSLRLNLPKNAVLRQRILSGEVKGEELVSLSSEDLISDHHKQLLEKGLKDVADAKRSDWFEENRDNFIKTAGIKQQEGMFKCGKCNSTKTSYYQKQTRSAE